MPNPVMHFEIIGRDGKAMRSFYGQAFNWDMDAPSPGMDVGDYTLVEPGAGIRGGIGTAPPGYGGHATFYVAVVDIEATIARLLSLGASVMKGPESIPGGRRIALFRDPEGHVVGLVQPSAEDLEG